MEDLLFDNYIPNMLEFAALGQVLPTGEVFI
jgi:hypothetical protein